LYYYGAFGTIKMEATFRINRRAMTIATKGHTKTKTPGNNASGRRKSKGRPRLRRANARTHPGQPEIPDLRADFGLSRKTLSRMTGLSERTVASWESGSKLNEANARALTTAERLLKALAEVVRKDAIAPWLDTPNDAFGGLKPVEVLERGESDRLWRMIYFLGSGSVS